MRRLLLLCLLNAVVHVLPAQSNTQPQPSSAFPFEIALYKPDSTLFNSKQVFKTGKPTVFAFWLTTCVPCMAELASYTEQYANWKKEVDFQLFAVSIDYPQRFRFIAPMVQEKKWPFPVYWDRERTFKSILPGGLNGLPQVFLFDRNGTLVWQHKGYYPGFEHELFAKIKELK
jgi:thiol-disulfide isomerase/thioredoxin